MVKKLTAFLLLMMLTLTLALADTQVQDDAGLFTADEIAEISAICDRIESAYQVDMFVLTSRDVPSGQTTAYADDYFDYNGLGMGDDRADDSLHRPLPASRRRPRVRRLALSHAGGRARDRACAQAMPGLTAGGAHRACRE